ncbi:MAG: ATP phosphoribosyltransferase [Anaerolineaceae bacterium]
MIKVALPNKGQLFEPTVELLTSCGYKVSKSPKSLSSLDPENNVEFYFLRPGDIPLYVASGVLDAGITGKDFAAEKDQPSEPLLDLNYGYSKLCAAVLADSPHQTLDEVARLRIATSFPTITRRFFAGCALEIAELEGAVEISVRLGIADAVVDVVETGSTLEQAGLRIVGEPLFRSNAGFFAQPGREEHEDVRVMRSRLQGRLVAYEYRMVEYDCPVGLVGVATRITPGIESPTITALQDEGWLSVKAMVKANRANQIMDELSRVGCKGILLTTIESARI